MQSNEKETRGHKLLEPGNVFGDYVVEKLLGKGGMGVVYLMRAQDGEQFAVKVLDPGVAGEKRDFVKRFLREAEFSARIRHRNLIPVHHVGEDPATGFCYLVMDYMPGGSLADRLEKLKRLPVDEAISIIVQIAAALEVAHLNGVVHRDVKPDNILFDLDGTPKLADMGVAKFMDGAHRTTVTTTGMIIGTPAYMAPEQMMDSHHVDARADIYSLGVVFYEMLTGVRPHEESTAVELLAKAIKGEPIPDVRTLRPEISAALAYVLSLMCAPKPEGRPPTPYAVVELFQKAENGTLDIPKEILVPRAPRRKRWKNLPTILMVAALLLAIGALGWLVTKGVRTFAATGGRQVVVVTNTVNVVSTVTNLPSAEQEEPDMIGGTDATGRNEQAPTTAGPVDGMRDGGREKKRNKPDFSTLDPIRYAKMDDRTLVRELVLIDHDGTIGREVKRHGGIDPFCRAKGPLSVARRKALVNVFILRDALVLCELPHEMLLAVLGKARNTPKVVTLPIGKLLAKLPGLRHQVAQMTSQKKNSAEIAQSVIDYLCASAESKTKPVPAPSGGAKAGNLRSAGSVTGNTATATVDRQVPALIPPSPEHEAILPFRVCVMDFTTTDINGQIRFVGPANNKLDITPRCTLNDADRKSVNDVMQGFVRLVDAVEKHKTKDMKNAITRNDAIAIWRMSDHGQSRPAVIGAEYLEAGLGGYGDVFACVDRPLMAAAMQKLQNDPDFPSDFQLKLAKASGATHLIYGTVGDIASRENSFSGFGVQAKATNFSIKVFVKMLDLVTQQTVHSGVYTGVYREQGPISGAQFDDNIFKSLMRSALQQAAEELYDKCRPGRKNKIRVTPLRSTGGKIGIAEPAKAAPAFLEGEVLIWDGTGWRRRSEESPGIR